MSSPEKDNAPNLITKAVILARGLGKRMRAGDSSIQLSNAQSQAADAGMKAMIPIGRPFLDYVLSALADAGFRDICLVVGPEHTQIREYYRKIPKRRIAISFAIQEKPIGTANAMLSVREFVKEESFMALNSDNYYPVEVFRAMQTLGEPGLPAFERESLIRGGDIPPERVRQYGLLQIGADGYLQKIIEKPGELAGAHRAEEVFISMNCWRFAPSIFCACEEVPISSRGEYELPEAVEFGLRRLGLRFKAVPFHEGVLDLSHRSDIAQVARRLENVRVEL